MGRPTKANLSLGPSVVQVLLPQRRPILMVDFVRSFSDDDVPTLEAGRHVSANEPVFEGHFPEMPIWPGAFTMEGLGQASSILLIITLLRRRAVADGRDPESVLESLRNLDRGFRMHAGYQPGGSDALLDDLSSFRSQVAVGASAELKFLSPVMGGCRLDYRVRWTEKVGDLVRFEVEASVDDEPVLEGTMTGARMERRISRLH